MRIDGEWYECDDGVFRPVIRGEVRAADGSWIAEEFQLDTGADRSVFSADLMAGLNLPSIEDTQLGGLAGTTTAALVETELRLTHEAGKIVIRGRYVGVHSAEVLDMSVLGQDLKQLFVFIVDWPGRVVCLLHPPHRYRIEVVPEA